MSFDIKELIKTVYYGDRPPEKQTLVIPKHEDLNSEPKQVEIRSVLETAAALVAGSGLLWRWQCYDGTVKLCRWDQAQKVFLRGALHDWILFLGDHWTVKDTTGQEFRGPSAPVADRLIQAILAHPGTPARRLGITTSAQAGGNQMKPSFESEQVQDLLVGICRCSPQTYYRVDESGRSIITPIRQRLMDDLGICSKTASLYLKIANLPITPFAQNQPDEADATPPAKPAKKCGPTPLTEEEREEKAAARDAVANNKRFQFIETNSGRYGVFDGTSGRVVSLFPRPEDAVAELTRLKTGRSYAIDNN
jgi:hypothetical protein